MTGVPFLILIFSSLTHSYLVDPTKQEIDLYDWTGGVRVAFCTDASVPEISGVFKWALTKIVNKYCVNNQTACNLKNTVQFTPEQVVFLDSFPRREFATLNFKFYLVLPHSSQPIIKQTKPLLSRAVISDILVKHISELENRLGWTLLSHERYPRYDAITEFMNIAIIPIVILSIPLMVFLAYWTSSLRPNMMSESWLVTGASGGKNYAYRRTLEIIAEQNMELELERKYLLTRHLPIVPTQEVVGKSTGLLLDVGKLSINASNLPLNAFYQASTRKILTPHPSITISESDSANEDQILSVPSSPQRLQEVPEHEAIQIEEGEAVHLNVHPYHQRGGRRGSYFRRQSSLGEGVEKRRHHRLASSSSKAPSARRWKAGSLILFGRRNK